MRHQAGDDERAVAVLALGRQRAEVVADGRTAGHSQVGGGDQVHTSEEPGVVNERSIFFGIRECTSLLCYPLKSSILQAWCNGDKPSNLPL